MPNTWIHSVRILDSAGDSLTDQVLKATCPAVTQEKPGGPAGPVPESARLQMHDCVTRINEKYHEVITYQPGARYWTFQWWELALFTALAALLCAYAFHRLRRPRW